MKSRHILAGQRVEDAKVARSKELRKEMTAAEKILWHHLRGQKLSAFKSRRQQVIDGFIVDFYCHSAGLVIEVDGQMHEGREEYDAERSLVLARRNLSVLRVSNPDVNNNLSNVLRRVLERRQQLTQSPTVESEQP